MAKRGWMVCCTIATVFVCARCTAQQRDSLSDRLANFPDRLFSRIQAKTAGLDRQLTGQTKKYLRRMAIEEQRLKKKLEITDPVAAGNLFDRSAQQYQALEHKLDGDTGKTAVSLHGAYMPYIDSLQTSLAFLQKNPQLLSASSGVGQKLEGSVSQLTLLQARLQDADAIKNFMQQRKAQISQYLSRYTNIPPGIKSCFDDYQKQAYYYSRQVKAYKEELNDPDKLLKRGLQVLNRVPAFTSYVKKNSMLASLLNIPSGTPTTSSTTGLGMADRDQVMSSIPGASGTNGPNVINGLQQNIQSAQGEIDELRSKLPAGSGTGDLDVPNFRPNSQKTRSFLRRLQLGTNLQSTHSSVFFPTTTDIGISIGYRITDKNTVGIGGSYKIGWGNDIRHVNVTGQGVGLRSFVDLSIRKTWYASGGFEYNYQEPFAIQGLPGNLERWQKSGLIGISKIIAMRTRVFKNTKIQLLWDFLSYQQVPRTQPLKFRIGYTF